ncbi:MAG: 3-methylaspartate ammonia-lyase [Gammaproteobacteria bacterium]|nr:MAG: 3-methylaspartate ammonia-lyase [Gammaproteobacteria bacterium]PHR82268.1 MAG: 3-methylaspartate ammonia-lyase [Colwellia sp.]
MNKIKVLTPTGMLGYGFPVEDFNKGIARNPDVIIIDSGSVDSGPIKIGNGSMTCPEGSYRAELLILLKAVHEHKIPLYISSAGGAGSNIQVDKIQVMVKEICEQQGYSLSSASIYADIPKEIIKDKLIDGKISACGRSVPALTLLEINNATTVVAQMGMEPFVEAIKNNVDVIIAGRAYDPAPLAAFCINKGFDPALSWHMGKILECGGLCAQPSCQVMLGTISQDHFTLEPLSEQSICTETSIAAHTMYEKSHPYLLPGPGGTLDLSTCKFEQIDERRVKVSGSQFNPTPYTIKLEGAKLVGYRSTTIAGVRDPNVISALDEIEVMAKGYALQNFPHLKDKFKLLFHVYGRDGVLGSLETDLTVAKEVCVVIEVLAETQDIATQVCSKARIALLHAPYKGRIATSGNCGLIFSPLEIPLGETYEFNIYHLMTVDDPCQYFPINYHQFG